MSFEGRGLGPVMSTVGDSVLGLPGLGPGCSKFVPREGTQVPRGGDVVATCTLILYHVHNRNRKSVCLSFSLSHTLHTCLDILLPENQSTECYSS